MNPSSPKPSVTSDLSHDPRFLAYRLDLHEHRISKLEARPHLPDLSSPMWGRLLLALLLLLIGSIGHYPAAEKIALKLLGAG